MRTPPPEQSERSEQQSTRAAHPAVAYATAGVALSAAAGLIHLWVAPEHFHEAWLVGTFFAVAGVGQLAFAVVLARGLGTSGLLVGVAANAGLVCLYVLSRTVTLPFLPAHDEGHVEHLPVAGASGNGAPVFPESTIEPVGILDMTCLLAELALIVMLVGLLPSRLRRFTTNALMGLGLVAVAARAVGVLG
jgi:hypothetical protein